MLASDLYAMSQNEKNKGTERCHWCGAATERGRERHNDPAPGIPMRSQVSFDATGRLSGSAVNPLRACCPEEPWICRGCWLWRRERISVPYLSGGMSDRQAPMKHSWFVTDKRSWGVRLADYGKLYELLLAPPRRFFLALLREKDKVPNLLHRAVANVFDRDVLAGDSLSFTLNNTPMTYSPYELEQALRNGSIGKDPGVRALVSVLGTYELPPVGKEKADDREGRRVPPKAQGQPEEGNVGRPAGKMNAKEQLGKPAGK